MYSVLGQVDEWVEKVREDVIMWRRHFHENPELSFEESETSQFIYDTLSTFPGLELSRPTKTSVMARLVGKQPGRVLAIRADMDALPIQEENNFEFASKVKGKMHACGHDGHTAMLLGAAKLLSSMKEQIQGEVRFLFQHAEELHPGGAEEMVRAGAMDGVDVVIGTHLWAPVQSGKIHLASGPLMASPDTFEISVIGQGGHAAQPHLTVDSIAVAAQVITNLQHVVSRNLDPLDPVVLSVTKIQGGTTDNVIPGAVHLLGTVRTFNSELRDTVPEIMERVIKGITDAHGASYTFRYQKGYRPVINDAEVTDYLQKAFVEAFGEDMVEDATPTMGGEDFSALQQKAPSSFFFIGARNEEKGITYPHHHPKFTIDEDALPIGVKAFIIAVFNILT